MSLTAEALKKLGSEAAEGAAKEAKDWETVSASAYESLDCLDKRALSEVKMLVPAESERLQSFCHQRQDAQAAQAFGGRRRLESRSHDQEIECRHRLLHLAACGV